MCIRDRSRYLSEEYNIFVRKTVQIILDRYVTKLSIKEIALELDVSASYLSRDVYKRQMVN